MKIAWQLRHFADLSGREVHDILQLRAEVFVVEQACVFQDVDGADPSAWHLLGTVGPGLRRGDESPGVTPAKAGAASADRLVAYARLIPAGIKFAEVSIGRVVTAPSQRRTGLGRELMREALSRAAKLWPGTAIRIGAQQRLERFYREQGFETVSAPYDEDGILHVEMLRLASADPDAAVSPAGQEAPIRKQGMTT